MSDQFQTPGQPWEPPQQPTQPPAGQPWGGQPAPGQPQNPWDTAQQYGQPPYGQAPYPQAPYGDAQAQYGQGPYAQGPYAQAPYGQYQYPQQQYSAVPVTPETPKKDTVGLVGLVIVLLSGIVALWAGYAFGAGSGQLAILAGIQPGTIPDEAMIDVTDPAIMALAESLAAPMGALILTAITGLVGFIVSIIGFAQRKGRKFGLWGIILGIVFPVAIFVAMTMGMAPAIT